jgi:hypothetical protein
MWDEDATDATRAFWLPPSFLFAKGSFELLEAPINDREMWCHPHDVHNGMSTLSLEYPFVGLSWCHWLSHVVGDVIGTEPIFQATQTAKLQTRYNPQWFDERLLGSYSEYRSWCFPTKSSWSQDKHGRLRLRYDMHHPFSILPILFKMYMFTKSRMRFITWWWWGTMMLRAKWKTTIVIITLSLDMIPTWYVMGLYMAWIGMNFVSIMIKKPLVVRTTFDTIDTIILPLV